MCLFGRPAALALTLTPTPPARQLAMLMNVTKELLKILKGQDLPTHWTETLMNRGSLAVKKIWSSVVGIWNVGVYYFTAKLCSRVVRVCCIA